MNSIKTFKQERIEIRNHMAVHYRDEISKDILNGLSAAQKSIPSKYFYDTSGSQLFEEICALPEYYQTRTELSILHHAAKDIMCSFERGDLVELGSGANWKIRTLLDAAENKSYLRYVPVDVCETAIVNASGELLEIYPDLEVLGIVADFTVHLNSIPADRPRIICFLGSTIGNLGNSARNNFLGLVAGSMNPSDRLLIGFDMMKSKKTLEKAYNDPGGITSKFNKNVLHVLNRELKADFDPSHFEHIAFFNEEKKRVEMHLQAKQKLQVKIDGLRMTVELNKDETIHTEVCNKFSKADIEKMADDAGLYIDRWFFDPRKWFSLTELRVKPAQ